MHRPTDDIPFWLLLLAGAVFLLACWIVLAPAAVQVPGDPNDPAYLQQVLACLFDPNCRTEWQAANPIIEPNELPPPPPRFHDQFHTLDEVWQVQALGFFSQWGKEEKVVETHLQTVSHTDIFGLTVWGVERWLSYAQKKFRATWWVDQYGTVYCLAEKIQMPRDDLNNDGVVNLRDFAEFSRNWLKDPNQP